MANKKRSGAIRSKYAADGLRQQKLNARNRVRPVASRPADPSGFDLFNDLMRKKK